MPQITINDFFSKINGALNGYGETKWGLNFRGARYYFGQAPSTAAFTEAMSKVEGLRNEQALVDLFKALITYRVDGYIEKIQPNNALDAWKKLYDHYLAPVVHEAAIPANSITPAISADNQRQLMEHFAAELGKLLSHNNFGSLIQASVNKGSQEGLRFTAYDELKRLIIQLNDLMMAIPSNEPEKICGVILKQLSGDHKDLLLKEIVFSGMMDDTELHEAMSDTGIFKTPLWKALVKQSQKRLKSLVKFVETSWGSSGDPRIRTQLLWLVQLAAQDELIDASDLELYCPIFNIYRRALGTYNTLDRADAVVQFMADSVSPKNEPPRLANFPKSTHAKILGNIHLIECVVFNSEKPLTKESLNCVMRIMPHVLDNTSITLDDRYNWIPQLFVRDEGAIGKFLTPEISNKFVEELKKLDLKDREKYYLSEIDQISTIPTTLMDDKTLKLTIARLRLLKILVDSGVKESSEHLVLLKDILPLGLVVAAENVHPVGASKKIDVELEMVGMDNGVKFQDEYDHHDDELNSKSILTKDRRDTIFNEYKKIDGSNFNKLIESPSYAHLKPRFQLLENLKKGSGYNIAYFICHVLNERIVDNKRLPVEKNAKEDELGIEPVNNNDNLRFSEIPDDNKSIVCESIKYSLFNLSFDDDRCTEHEYIALISDLERLSGSYKKQDQTFQDALGLNAFRILVKYRAFSIIDIADRPQESKLFDEIEEYIDKNPEEVDDIKFIKNVKDKATKLLHEKTSSFFNDQNEEAMLRDLNRALSHLIPANETSVQLFDTIRALLYFRIDSMKISLLEKYETLNTLLDEKLDRVCEDKGYADLLLEKVLNAICIDNYHTQTKEQRRLNIEYIKLAASFIAKGADANKMSRNGLKWGDMALLYCVDEKERAEVLAQPASKDWLSILDLEKSTYLSSEQKKVITENVFMAVYKKPRDSWPSDTRAKFSLAIVKEAFKYNPRSSTYPGAICSQALKDAIPEIITGDNCDYVFVKTVCHIMHYILISYRDRDYNEKSFRVDYLNSVLNSDKYGQLVQYLSEEHKRIILNQFRYSLLEAHRDFNISIARLDVRLQDSARKEKKIAFSNDINFIMNKFCITLPSNDILLNQTIGNYSSGATTRLSTVAHTLSKVNESISSDVNNVRRNSREFN